MSDYVRIRGFDQRTLQIVEELSSIFVDYIKIAGAGGEDPLEARLKEIARLDRGAH